eukprot:TRINITY_DN12060_c0_g1_i4.p1 TRINITY_DN12060_c0_g1~~TRINITY_DN12060_c0_g1_i4.p1  ORF type:complete len:357 (+),score=50.61 TRINITY_DN12060_c0_g1_i4:1372-2442(+)
MVKLGPPQESRTRSQSPSDGASPSISPTIIEPEELSYNSTRSGGFGHSVCFLGDDLFASRPRCINQNNCDGGRAVLLRKNLNDEWVGQAVIAGRQRNGDSQFGNAVAFSDNWLAVSSAAVAYYGASTPIINIFRKNDTSDTIDRVAGLRPKNNNQTAMEFGHSIAIGQNDTLVGAPGYDLNGDANAGVVLGFRFRVTVNRWGRHPSLMTAYDAAAHDRFGHSVSLEGTFLAIGNDPTDTTRQAVYVMTKSGHRFEHFQKLMGTGKLGFGWVVLLLEDELVVSAPKDDNSGAATNGGSVTAFAKNGTNHFEEYSTIYHAPFTANRRFGHSVSRIGDRMAIGSNTCPNGAPDQIAFMV